MTDEKLKQCIAWGRLLRVADTVLGGISDTEQKSFLQHPGLQFPITMKKMMDKGIEPRLDAQLAMILDDIDLESMKNVMNSEEQGTIMLNYYQYDTDLLTIAEAAELKGCSKAYIYKLIEKKKIPVFEVRGKKSIAKRELNKYM